jgi:hypothetical protein
MSRSSRLQEFKNADQHFIRKPLAGLIGGLVSFRTKVFTNQK